MKNKIIVLTVCEWICVLIASAFALQTEFSYYDVVGSVGYLSIAGFLEYLKYLINEENKED